MNVGLFNYIQLFIISNGVNTKYFCNNKSLSSKQLFYWTDTTNKRYSKLDEFSDIFLEPCHLSKMICKYIVLHHSDSLLMVLRPYQYYAAEAILKKVEGSVNNGYIWHTTGSGKTLTSFKTSQLLTESKLVDKIVFVVDRKDLDYQTTREFNYFSEDSVTGTENTKSLVKQLSLDNKLVITTIQKLTNAVKKDKHNKILKKIKEKRLVFIFDECHRSQFGTMHKLITDFFKNHQSFGFTGTPILAENANNNKTTKDIFDDCLHKYVIKDAIDDDNVLGFSVEYFSTFQSNKEMEDEEVLSINKTEVFDNPKRQRHIVENILKNHNRKTFNREFNSIFAVSSISALINYYEIFKSFDHNLIIATIFSYDANEDPNEKRAESSRDKLQEFMKDYNIKFGTNFSALSEGHLIGKPSSNDFNAYYIDVAKKVKEKKIDILLVVNMFLTGFDSKSLNTLYVDKNLQYHGLIQAFSRTNRILNEKKKHGNIICYRALKNNTDTAITLYSDKDAIDTVIMKPYEDYLKQFEELLSILLNKYPDVSSIDDLEGEEEKKEFIELFRNILRLKTQLNSFSQFDFDDTQIEEQEFEDYISKYKDLYDQIKTTEAEKTSILDDIDFEMELLRRDDINVDYILSLLNNLDVSTDDFIKEKETILSILSNSIELKSKKELIERFMDEILINKDENILDGFDLFISLEKQKEIKKFSEKENLDQKIIEKLLDEHGFTGRIDEDILESSINENFGLLKRRAKKKDLLRKIEKLIEKFSF